MCSALTDDHSDLSWFLALKVEPNANKIPLTSQAGLFVKLLLHFIQSGFLAWLETFSTQSASIHNLILMV